jgi:hypothetical protein
LVQRFRRQIEYARLAWECTRGRVHLFLRHGADIAQSLRNNEVWFHVLEHRGVERVECLVSAESIAHQTIDLAA